MNMVKKFYTLLLLIIVLLSVWIYFIYIPYTTYISNTEEELASYKKKISSATEANKRLDSLHSQLSQRALQLDNLEQKLIDNSSLDEIINTLVMIMASKGIKVINVTPSKSYFLNLSNTKKNEKYLSELPLDMMLEARFLDLGRFLENLDTLPFWLQPKGIYISENATNSHKLSINLMASIYVKTGTSL